VNREELVTVRTKDGGAIAFSHGSCSLKLAAGEIADKWMDGSPITRGEFEAVLAPHAEVEIVEAAPSARDAKVARGKEASFKSEA
jgi:hypothetical protein